MRHHSAGVEWAIEKFGHSIANSDARTIPVKLIAEQHVMEDMGFLPSPDWWLSQMMLVPAMNKVPTKPGQEQKGISPVEELRRTLAHELYKGEG